MALCPPVFFWGGGAAKMAEYDKATETRWIQNYCEHAERAPGHRRIAQPALLSHRLNFWHGVALFSQRLPECKNPSWRARSQQLITGPTAISTSVDTRVRCRHADDGRRPRPRVIFAKAHRPHQLTTIRWALALNRNEKATRGGRAPPRDSNTARVPHRSNVYSKLLSIQEQIICTNWRETTSHPACPVFRTRKTVSIRSRWEGHAAMLYVCYIITSGPFQSFP